MENIPKNSQPKTDDVRLSVGALSMDIRPADVDYNLNTVKTQLSKHGHEIDLLVLPELFTTAFKPDAEQLHELAESDNGRTMGELKVLAKEYGIAIAGSFLAQSSGAYYNRGFFIKPCGEAVFYNKRHLFGLSEESVLLTPGAEAPPVVEYRGWRIALIVCYDLRFPVWCRRNDCNCQYDLLLVVANWPQSRQYAWEHLLIARAIENQSVVIGVDRSGTDEYGVYNGMSRFFDSTGHAIECKDDGCMQIVDISYRQLTEFRRRWPMANDADCFTII